ncbi:MAG TPA: MATE family efflux transporter [Rhabdochlamydiaceae bacterium]|nr:MATE family efflux transporter [Rhabdochlamydiaceae bacterium]
MHKIEIPNLKKIPTHFLVTATAWISRGANILVRIFTLPILLRYLGIEQFAILSIVLSLEGWFLLCDLGIGSALQNYLSEARAKKEDIEPFLSAVTQSTLLLFIVFFGLLYFLNHHIQNWIFKDFTIEQTELIFFVGSIYIFTAVGSIGYKALYALQKGYWIHVLQAAGAILSSSIAMMLPFIYHGEQKLVVVIAAMTIFPAFFACLAFYFLFLKRNPFRYLSWEPVKMILKRGIGFGAFALLSNVGLLVDYLIMARTLTADQIASYHVLSKIFLSLFFLYNALLLAVWPKCSELLARNQWLEVTQIMKKYILFGSILITISTLSVSMFSTKISSVFFKSNEVIFSQSTIYLFGIYLLIRIVSDTYSTVFQSMSYMKVFFIFVPAQVLLIVFAEYYLSLKFGIDGILWGLIGAFAVTVLWGLPYAFRMKKKRVLKSLGTF